MKLRPVSLILLSSQALTPRRGRALLSPLAAGPREDSGLTCHQLQPREGPPQ